MFECEVMNIIILLDGICDSKYISGLERPVQFYEIISWPYISLKSASIIKYGCFKISYFEFHVLLSAIFVMKNVVFRDVTHFMLVGGSCQWVAFV